MIIKWIQAALFAGFCLMPTSVFAEGLLDQVTEEVIETQNVSKVDAEEQAEQVQTSESEEDTDSLEANPVVAVVSTAVSEVNQIKTKASNQLPTTPSVTVNTKAIQVEVSESPKVKIETDIVELDVSDTASVKLDTDLAEVEIGEDGSVKVKTDILEGKISDKVEAKVETTIIDAEVGEEGTVISAPSEEYPLPDSDESDQVKGSKAEISLVRSINRNSDSRSSIIQDRIKEVFPLPEGESENLKKANRTSTEELKSNLPFNKPIAEDAFNDSNALVPVQNSGNGPTTTNSMQSGSSSFLASILAGRTMLLDSLGKNAMNGQVAFYHDQWLNAPPSQPPQKTFFL